MAPFAAWKHVRLVAAKEQYTRVVAGATVAACGLDFGTSNTAVAAFPGGEPVTHSESSLLYFSQPSGGTYQMYVGSEARARYVANGFRGRYVRTIKSLLADPEFEWTDVYGRRYRVEQLVAAIMRHFKDHADGIAGGDVELVVVGRPVVFSSDEAADDLAEARLRAAAEAAGFRYVHVLPEPVAAARTYAATAEEEAVVLVADFGGGTCDFCAFRLRPGRALDRRRDVIATAGVARGRHRLRPKDNVGQGDAQAGPRHHLRVLG